MTTLQTKKKGTDQMAALALSVSPAWDVGLARHNREGRTGGRDGDQGRSHRMRKEEGLVQVRGAGWTDQSASVTAKVFSGLLCGDV